MRGKIHSNKLHKTLDRRIVTTVTFDFFLVRDDSSTSRHGLSGSYLSNDIRRQTRGGRRTLFGLTGKVRSSCLMVLNSSWEWWWKVAWYVVCCGVVVPLYHTMEHGDTFFVRRKALPLKRKFGFTYYIDKIYVHATTPSILWWYGINVVLLSLKKNMASMHSWNIFLITTGTILY